MVGLIEERRLVHSPAGYTETKFKLINNQKQIVKHSIRCFVFSLFSICYHVKYLHEFIHADYFFFFFSSRFRKNELSDSLEN